MCYQLRLCRSADALGAAALSLFGTVWLFAASGSFHRSEWPDVEHEDFAAKARRARARAASRVEHEPRPLVPLRAPLSARAQLDYVGIFLQVAFSGAPLYVLLDPPKRRTGWLVLGGLAATVAAGALVAFADVEVGRRTITLVYLAQGLTQLLPLGTRAPFGRRLWDALRARERRMLVCMAACYVGGSQLYASAAPALWPATFGFHELWHLLIVVASACTYLVNCSVIRRSPPPRDSAKSN